MTKQLYLLIFTLSYFLIAFFYRSYLLWKNTGINPLNFDKTDNAHGFNVKMFKLTLALTWVVIGIYVFGDDYYKYLLPFWYLENTILEIIGWVLMVFSLVWVFTAQLQMANSWRIGIDKNNKSELVTKGLFSISRNPIFLGVIFTNVGLFLVIPNAFTLLLFSISTICIQTQVRLEEVFLREQFGVDYEEYLRRVSRWV